MQDLSIDQEGRDAQDDNHLARLAQDGDGEALGRLYDRHVEFVHRYLERRVRGDTATAEDLVQDTFVKVLRALDDGRYDPESGHAFRGWLTRIAANVCTDHFRRQSSRPTTEAPMPSDETDQPEAEPLAPFGADPLPPMILDALLDQLPPHARRVMRFRRSHPDLTEAECAERLELSLEAYKKSVKRSFARLRTLEGSRREEILDATYPWQNRGADGAGPMDDAVSACTGLDPAVRQRIRSVVLGAHAALRRGG